MAIPSAFLTWYSGEQIIRNSEISVAESSLAELNANRKLIENAMDHLSQNTVTLASTQIFDRVRSYETYIELNSDYNHVNDAKEILRELMYLNRMIDGAYSTFFYLEDADYLISTDKGITKLDRYESTDWIEGALIERRGINGVWHPRKLSAGINVISYILPLNRLSTNTRGTIVVNLKESQVGNYFSLSELSNQGYMLIDLDGTVISHHDKNFLLGNGKENPFIREVLAHELNEGYAFGELEGEQILYTWSQSKGPDWLNIGVYSVHELMGNALTMQRNIKLFTISIIFVGVILTIFVARWVSKPVRKLVENLRSNTNLSIKEKNEMDYLDLAFKRMREEEEALHRLLNTRENDSQSLAIHHIFRGELTPQIFQIFSHSNFLTAVVSIDQYRKYTSKNNRETRSYDRYLFITMCDSIFPKNIVARSIYQGDGCFAILINYGQREHDEIDLHIHATFYKIQDEAKKIFKCSVTIGISSPANKISFVYYQFSEAMEAIKNRMIEGNDGINYWEKREEYSKKYIYPVNSERRILNYLDQGELNSIINELGVIGNKIRSASYISYDNIIFIYHQLVGICIKHLRENNVSMAQIFMGRGNIYSTLASIDTLEELQEYLVDFFSDIMQYLIHAPEEVGNYGKRILNYLDEHYREDIIFQEMAEDIGISYSYMRKIVNEMTGQSLIDHLNLRRIMQAKQMLVESELTIAQIANEVGYNNVQSLNRYFRKFEGMPPSAYRMKISQSE